MCVSPWWHYFVMSLFFLTVALAQTHNRAICHWGAHAQSTCTFVGDIEMRKKQEDMYVSSEMIRTFSPRMHLGIACWTRMRFASSWFNVICVRFIRVPIPISTGTQSSQCSDMYLCLLIGCLTSDWSSHRTYSNYTPYCHQVRHVSSWYIS